MWSTILYILVVVFAFAVGFVFGVIDSLNYWEKRGHVPDFNRED